jgi:hypothetical protein
MNARAQAHQLFEAQYLPVLTPTVAPGQAVWADVVRSRLRVPHAEQVRFTTSTAKRKVIRAGRRGGKTCGVALLALEAFLTGRRILYAVPVQDQVDRFWYEVKRALEPAIDAGHVVKNETRHQVELPRTETRIRAKTAWNSDTLRGDYCDLLILDEYQLMNESAWNEVGAPMLLDNNGDVVFVYTPPSVRQRVVSKAQDKRHAAKLFKAAVADTSGRWATFTFASHANPYLSTVALEEITGDMSALAYRQEILAEDIETIPGALWSLELLDTTRVTDGQVPPLVRIVVALDPAGTSRETSDEMGIVACGKDAGGHGYTLRDASRRGTPAACARVAIRLYDQLEADALIVESNNGAEWLTTTLAFVAQEMYRQGERATPHLHTKSVHASRGKATRAEPVSAESEQGRIHAVGVFPELETEMTTWVPGMPSPSRMDALVWAYTELLLGAHVPRDLSLAPMLGHTQRPLGKRTAPLPGRGMRHGAADPAQSAAERLIRQRWGMNEYEDDDY